MRTSIAIVLSVCLTLVVDATSWARQFRHTLRGNVKVAASGEPPAVRIQLQKSGMTLQETFARENRFEFPNVEGGSYTLVVSASGYDTVQQEVNVPDDWVLIELRPPRNSARRAEAVPVWALKVPESALHQFEAAKKNILEHNCVDALSHLRKAVHAYAEYGEAHQAMGECYGQMNQLETAEQEFKLALEQPHAPELHLRLAKVYERSVNPAMHARQVQFYMEEKASQQRDHR